MRTTPRRVRVAAFLLRLVLERHHANLLVADLEELYAARVGSGPRWRTILWYASQVLGLATSLAFRTTHQTTPLRHQWSSSMRSSLSERLITALRQAAQRVARDPRHHSVTAGILGLGIGGVVTIVSLANWALLRPVPGVADPHALVTILLESTESEGWSTAVSHPDYRAMTDEWLRGVPLTAYRSLDVHVASAAAAERLTAEAVGDRYFTVLGAPIVRGRSFTAQEDSAGRDARVAVIDYALWERLYRKADSAVGARLVINSIPFTVVGVTAPGFRGATLPSQTDLWIPTSALPTVQRSESVLSDRMANTWRAFVARPSPSWPIARIERELAAGVAQLRAQRIPHSFLATHLIFRAHPGVGLSPLKRAKVLASLRLLFGAAALLLLLTCANAANLGLVRSVSQRSSLAVRLAFGASMRRLVLERLLDHLLVGLAGAFVGLCSAAFVLRLLQGARVAQIEIDGVPLIDWRVGAAAIATALVAAVLAGLLPALSVRGTRIGTVLRSQRHGGARASRSRYVLASLQVALSLILLVGASLLVRTVRNLQRVDLGFSTDSVLTFALDPERQGYDNAQSEAFIERLLTVLRADKRVTAVGLAHMPALSDGWITARLSRPQPDTGGITLRSFRVTPGFFQALGLSYVGSDFTSYEWLRRDTAQQQIAILSEDAARDLLPGRPAESVIGESLRSRRKKSPPLTVVGILRRANLDGVADKKWPYLFYPWSQGWEGQEFTVYVRSRAPLPDLARTIRPIVQQLDPSLPVYALEPLEMALRRQTADQRLIAGLAFGLAAVALVLASFGLFVLLTQLILERQFELGVRSALGATPARLARDIVRRGVLIAVAGTSFGLYGAWATARLLESRLVGVSARDPLTYVVATLVLVVISVVASGRPALRAANLEVVTALKTD